MEFLSNDLVLILCSVIGFALLVLEAFMPGFGVAGLCGIVLEVIAVYCAWAYHGTVFALCVTLAIVLITGITVFLAYRSAVKGRLSKSPIILTSEEKADAGSSAEQLKDFISIAWSLPMDEPWDDMMKMFKEGKERNRKI